MNQVVEVMTKGSIQNREAFLTKIAGKMRRKPPNMDEVLQRPVRQFQPEKEVLKNASQADLLEALKEQCVAIHTDVVETDAENLSITLEELLAQHGQGKRVIAKDDRFTTFGLTELLEAPSTYLWDVAKARENINQAEKAKTGIMFSDITLAESATVVIFNDKDKARSIGLLPETFIAIIPASTLVPRMTQASAIIDEKINKGETISSCVNFISGPSNSADIEYNLVVGVHGPVKASYIVVTDK